jgi:2,4-dienoyl-CoA reductase-like NADH-dependent reductase (Old Yellow Enzyme family)
MDIRHRPLLEPIQHDDVTLHNRVLMAPKPNRETFYQGGPRGYIDYPKLR